MYSLSKPELILRLAKILKLCKYLEINLGLLNNSWVKQKMLRNIR